MKYNQDLFTKHTEFIYQVGNEQFLCLIYEYKDIKYGMDNSASMTLIPIKKDKVADFENIRYIGPVQSADRRTLSEIFHNWLKINPDKYIYNRPRIKRICHDFKFNQPI